MFYVGGLFIGFFGFEATVQRFWNFYNNSGFMDRFTIPQWLGLPAGVVVFIVVLMALFMFWGAEKLEAIFTKRRGDVK